MARQIPLSGKRGAGLFAIVDDEDYERLSGYRWCVAYVKGRRAYANRGFRIGGRFQKIQMHREVLGYLGPLQVDHINGDPLDNRKANLRLVTHDENTRNAFVTRRSATGFKGVFPRKGRFAAAIEAGNQRHRLGSFPSPEAAARAYDEAARRLHGPFARLNYPLPGEQPARRAA